MQVAVSNASPNVDHPVCFHHKAYGSGPVAIPVGEVALCVFEPLRFHRRVSRLIDPAWVDDRMGEMLHMWMLCEPRRP